MYLNPVCRLIQMRNVQENEPRRLHKGYLLRTYLKPTQGKLRLSCLNSAYKLVISSILVSPSTSAISVAAPGSCLVLEASDHLILKTSTNSLQRTGNIY